MKLYSATLDSWTLGILDISDTLNQTLVHHEYINMDGADIQSTGARARTIRFRTFWFGEDFDLSEVQFTGGTPAVTGAALPTYVNHFDFLNWLESNIDLRTKEVHPHTLIHPKYGAKFGFVNNFHVTHDDTQDYCTIDIDFVEDSIQRESFAPSTSTVEFSAQYAKQLDDLIIANNTLMKSLGHASALDVQVNSKIKFVNQITKNVSVATQAFLKGIDDNIGIINSYLDAIPNLANSVDNAVQYAGDIPSEIILTCNRACNRLITSLANVADTPRVFVSNFVNSMMALKNTLTGADKLLFQGNLMSVSSASLISQAGTLLTADQANTAAAGAVQAFDMNGNRTSVSLPRLPMSRQDIEAMVNQIQIYVQLAIAADRYQPSLRDMMAKLNRYVNFIKLSRLTVQTIQVNTQPVFSLLMSLGKPYNQADNFRALNPQIKNPAFFEGQVKIYA